MSLCLPVCRFELGIWFTFLIFWWFCFFYSPDTQRIFVDIGLGFHVEFTWSEALNYISLREEQLAKYVFFH